MSKSRIELRRITSQVLYRDLVGPRYAGVGGGEAEQKTETLSATVSTALSFAYLEGTTPLRKGTSIHASPTLLHHRTLLIWSTGIFRVPSQSKGTLFSVFAVVALPIRFPFNGQICLGNTKRLSGEEDAPDGFPVLIGVVRLLVELPF